MVCIFIYFKKNKVIHVALMVIKISSDGLRMIFGPSLSIIVSLRRELLYIVLNLLLLGV